MYAYLLVCETVVVPGDVEASSLHSLCPDVTSFTMAYHPGSPNRESPLGTLQPHKRQDLPTLTGIDTGKSFPVSLVTSVHTGCCRSHLNPGVGRLLYSILCG